MTRDGHKWIVLRAEYGGPYVVARSDSIYAMRQRKRGTYAGMFRTMREAQARAKQLNTPSGM